MSFFENKLLMVGQEQKQLISKIRAEKISKYNCQPDIKLNIAFPLKKCYNNYDPINNLRKEKCYEQYQRALPALA